MCFSPSSGRVEYLCEYCGMMDTDKHNCSTSPPEAQLILLCHLCGLTCHSSRELNNHIETCGSPARMACSVELCPMCLEDFDDAQRYNEHLLQCEFPGVMRVEEEEEVGPRSKTNSTEFPCTHCKRVFSRKQNQLRHEKTCS